MPMLFLILIHLMETFQTNQTRFSLNQERNINRRRKVELKLGMVQIPVALNGSNGVTYLRYVPQQT